MTWKILDEIPIGWKIDKTAGSPVARTVFITNGKSVLYGQERALLRQNKTIVADEKKYVTIETKKDPVAPVDYQFPAKIFNDLARKKMQEKLLQDIRVDLMICEIEGWNKKEYILEIVKLVASLSESQKGML